MVVVIFSVLSPVSSAQRLFAASVAAGAWDERGYVPFESTGPIPAGLVRGINLLRTANAKAAWPLVWEYNQNNPRDIHGIKALVDAAKMMGKVRLVFNRYRILAQAKVPKLWDQYGLVASGYALNWQRSEIERVMIERTSHQLWSSRKVHLAYGFLVSDLRITNNWYSLMRERADVLVKENPKVPEVYLLQAINYGSGGYGSFVNPKTGKKERMVSDEPKLGAAVTMLTNLRQRYPQWALLVFLHAKYLALQMKNDDALRLFKAYLALNPPPASREARKARAFLVKPHYMSLWLPEDYREYGVTPPK